ncbi:MAG: hypothetical protein B7733_19475 [Myxococcales bacterium FL481]|nr:MAG: hypothetical protein B7733_19475 [Myxococcales bacterium FL481]
MASTVGLIALIEAVPEQPCIDAAWLDRELRSRWSLPACAAPSAAEAAHEADPNPGPKATIEAWAVATVSGNETLVQSRPRVVSDSACFLDDLLRPRTRCTIGAYSVAPEGSRPATIPVPRYHRWVGFATGTGTARASEVARTLCQSLPPFLQRARGQHERDCPLFFAFLGCLHGAGGLGQRYPEPAEVRAALRDLNDQLGEAGSDANLMVTDGRSFAVLHRCRAFALTSLGEPAGRSSRPGSGPVLAGRHTPAASVLILSETDAEPTARRLARGVFSIDLDAPDEVVHDA